MGSQTEKGLQLRVASAVEAGENAGATCTRCTGWLCVGGSAGKDCGVQPRERMMRSASRKLRNRLATMRSWRNSCKNMARGSTDHAMVSVMVVYTQLISP